MTGFEERSKLMEQMLDKLYPFSPKMSKEERAAVERKRYLFASYGAWITWMSSPIEELRQLVANR